MKPMRHYTELPGHKCLPNTDFGFLYIENNVYIGRKLTHSAMFSRNELNRNAKMAYTCRLWRRHTAQSLQINAVGLMWTISWLAVCSFTFESRRLQVTALKSLQRHFRNGTKCFHVGIKCSVVEFELFQTIYSRKLINWSMSLPRFLECIIWYFMKNQRS